VRKESLCNTNGTVTPAKAWVQKQLKNLDSGFRRNDIEGFMKKPQVTKIYSVERKGP
jgi:hypothetical protein